MNNLTELKPEISQQAITVASLIRDELHAVRRKQKLLFLYAENYNEVLFKLGDLSPYTIKADLGNIDIVYTGDKERLLHTVRVLRSCHFIPNAKPTEGNTSYGTYFEHNSGAKIWMYFSSSVCRRVKVGTETKTVDVYEVRCSDLVGLEELRGGG